MSFQCSKVNSEQISHFVLEFLYWVKILFITGNSTGILESENQ